MARKGFTLIELLVVTAIVAVLVGLLLPAVQKVRAAAARVRCANNLKQLGLGMHNYSTAHGKLAEGKGPAPAEASVLVAALPFLDQQPAYALYDFGRHLTNHPANSVARTRDIPTYLCPADPSDGYHEDPGPPPGQPVGRLGRSNYFGNMGDHGSAYERWNGAARKDGRRAGMYSLDKQVRFEDVADGASNTALFAEVKRGARPGRDALDATVVAPPSWDNRPANPATNPSNDRPPPECDAPAATLNYTGLQYTRGSIITAFYTHTVPPNYPGRDCVRLGIDQGHLAARSYHPGGVNVALADGAVRFVGDRVRVAAWKALGTRGGGETATPFDD